MTTRPDIGLMLRAGSRVGVLAAVAGAAASGHAQEIRDWLPAEGGLWTDAINWSGGNTPDTIAESARIVVARTTPMAALPVVIDTSIEIDSLLSNGELAVEIAPGASLFVNSGIGFEHNGSDFGAEEAVLLVGGATEDDAIPRLEFGPGAFLTRARIDMNHAFGDAEIEADDGLSLLDGSSISGAGLISGEINLFDGFIEASDVNESANTLTIDSKRFVNAGALYAGAGAELVIFADEFLQTSTGRVRSAATVRFLEAQVSGGALSNVEGGEIRFEHGCSLENVLNESDNTRVTGELTILGAALTNPGGLIVEPSGSLVIEQTVALEGDGVLQLGTDQGEGLIDASFGAELINLAGHEIRGYGTMRCGLINAGDLTISGDEPGSNDLRVARDVQLLSQSVLRVGVDTSGDLIGSDRLLIDRSDADLGGGLVITIAPDATRGSTTVIGQPMEVVRVLGSGVLTGEFSEVTLTETVVGAQSEPRVEYLEDRVLVTLLCLADVNRDGRVSPADFSAWTIAFNSGGTIADQNLDGMITPSDFSGWVVNYNSGCGRD